MRTCCRTVLGGTCQLRTVTLSCGCCKVLAWHGMTYVDVYMCSPRSVHYKLVVCLCRQVPLCRTASKPRHTPSMDSVLGTTWHLCEWTITVCMQHTSS